MTFEAVYYYIPNIWIVFALVLWEGLLGGAAYVNTFYKMTKEVRAFVFFPYEFVFITIRSLSNVCRFFH